MSDFKKYAKPKSIETNENPPKSVQNPKANRSLKWFPPHLEIKAIDAKTMKKSKN